LLSVRSLKRLNLGPLNLDISSGEIIALCGPSGVGKSLLLRAIADLDPNEGNIRLTEIARESMAAHEWRKQVMYVPAHSGWWADVVEPHFESALKSDVVDVLHKLGLESTALGWQVANLSTGERQRLSLARALVLKPKILMLDEPTTGLDGENKAKMELVIRNYAADGAGIIFVTHEPEQATRLSSRRLVLIDGQLKEASS